MGFFSKKEYVCEKCGMVFQQRKKPFRILCSDCLGKVLAEEAELEKTIKGYIDYGVRVLGKIYSADEMRQIIARRNSILDKYKQETGISRAELRDAGFGYKSLTDEQAMEVLLRAYNSSLSTTVGAAYCGKFFAPTKYEGMIVDVDDVFAIGITSDYKHSGNSTDVILCAVFTNDPYVPVLPMVYVAKKGILDWSKSKKGREGVTALFEALCPNLTYPVSELKPLKKQIMQEGMVKGNIDLQFMLNQIGFALTSSGAFDTDNMHSELNRMSADMLDSIGYITEDEINSLLLMDKLFNRKFWNKHAEMLSKMN